MFGGRIRALHQVTSQPQNQPGREGQGSVQLECKWSRRRNGLLRYFKPDWPLPMQQDLKPNHTPSYRRVFFLCSYTLPEVNICLGASP